MDRLPSVDAGARPALAHDQQSKLRQRRSARNDTFERTSTRAAAPQTAAPQAATSPQPPWYRRWFFPSAARTAPAVARANEGAAHPPWTTQIKNAVVSSINWIKQAFHSLKPIVDDFLMIGNFLGDTAIGAWVGRHVRAVLLVASTGLASLAACLGIHWLMAAGLVALATVCGLIGLRYVSYGIMNLAAWWRGETRAGSMQDALKAVTCLQASGAMCQEILLRPVNDLPGWATSGYQGKKRKILLSSLNRQAHQGGNHVVVSATALARALIPDPTSGGRFLNMGNSSNQLWWGRKLAATGMRHDAVAITSAQPPNEEFLKEALAKVGTHAQLQSFRDAHPSQTTTEMDLRRAELALHAEMDPAKNVAVCLLFEDNLTPRQSIDRMDLIRQVRAKTDSPTVSLPQVEDLLPQLRALGTRDQRFAAQPLSTWDAATQARWWELCGDLQVAGNHFVAARNSYEYARGLNPQAASPTFLLREARAWLNGQTLTDVIMQQHQPGAPRVQNVRWVATKCRDAFTMEAASPHPRHDILAQACVGVALDPPKGDSAETWLMKAWHYAPRDAAILQALRAALPAGSAAAILYKTVQHS